MQASAKQTVALLLAKTRPSQLALIDVKVRSHMVSRNAFRVSRRLGKCQRLLPILTACADGDVLVRAMGLSEIQSWLQRYNHTFFAKPTDHQIETAMAAGERLGEGFSGELRRTLLEWRKP